MKKYIFIIAALAVVACSDFLDQQPYSEIVDDNYFTNDAEIDAGVVGCYSQLQAVMDNEWVVTELRSDNTRISSAGSNSASTKEFVQMDQNAFLSGNTYLSSYWEACYTGVARCNNVLLHTHKVTDPALGKRMDGELLFMRSLLYFNLVRLWGPVFLMDKPISSLEARYKQRSAVGDVYDFIIADLNRIIAEDMLPARAAQPAKDKGRAVMEAAKSLLAKVYVTRYAAGSEQYVAAGDLLKEVIVACGDPQTVGNLVPFADIFDVQKEMNDEIIFAVRYKSGKLGLGNRFGNLFAPSSSGAAVIIGDGSGYNYVTSNVINAFNSEPADKRIAVSYAESYAKPDGTIITEATNKGKARHILKFLDKTQSEKNDGECDWPVIRLGDVLLLYAEVRNELQDPAEALKYLNLVRARAGLDAQTITAVYELRQAIRTERRKELVFENHRFHDLVRWGTAVETLNSFISTEGLYDNSTYPYTPIKEWCLLMPLPQKVMNINPDLAQNHGY